jgi:hypothetical protein
VTAGTVVGVAAILCTLLVAFIGAVWRLGTKVAETNTDVKNAGTTLRDVIATIRDFDQRIVDQDHKISRIGSDCENTRQLAHKLVETVQCVVSRVTTIEARCDERTDVSRRSSVRHDRQSEEDGVPELVGCPLPGEKK